MEPLGASYSGSINHTTSGRTFQAWSGRNGEGEHSFCRNPNGNVLGVWCYTSDKEWEHCSVPLSSPTYDCQEGDPLGATYQGKVNKTVSGRTCQAWSAQEPQEHTTPWVGDHNYCRINNPTGGVRCLTTDPDKRWEFCDVPICVNDKQELSTIDPGCQEGSPLGASYSGNMNVTANGRPCRSWSDSTFYSSEGEHNHCRNPSRDLRGVWCYVRIGNLNIQQEFCSVPKCDETTGPQGNPSCQENTPWLGASYSGKVNVTTSGLTCKSWSRLGSLEDHNFCRSPDMEAGGVWCYTAIYPIRTWDYCSVPRCNATATYTCQNRTFEEGIQQYGPLVQTMLVKPISL